jgi:hypothetical protein
MTENSMLRTGDFPAWKPPERRQCKCGRQVIELGPWVVQWRSEKVPSGIWTHSPERCVVSSCAGTGRAR